MNNPESGRTLAKAMGATRNTLFLKDGMVIRILEFPDGATPVPMGELVERDPNLKSFLRKLGPRIQDGFDIDQPASLEVFNRRITLNLAYDVRV